ncbi:XdhC family protein [Candidatus Cloacimonadota bacterium]
METPVFEIMNKAVKNQQEGKAFVLATIVEGVEKTPGRSGFKLISYEDGTFEGTVGGGKLERIVLDKCIEVHQNRKNSFLEFELTETSSGIGMVCGGIAKVFLEYYPPNKRAYIFGAGHLCRSLVPILSSIGFYIIVIDNREDFADKDRIPLANAVVATDYLEYLEKFNPTENDAVIIFTHGHIHDVDIIDALCRKNVSAKYIGMIGSKIKVQQALDKVRNNDYEGNLIDLIHAPIGLNIGKTTTQEISIAIAAEVLAVYNGVEKVEFLKDMM